MAKKGYKQTQEHIVNAAKGRKGRPLSEAHRKKLSESNPKFWLGKKLPDEAKRKISEGQLGEKNPYWKGDKVGYRGLHKWVEKRLGKPRVCDNCLRADLPHRSYHWANKSRQYKRELNDWMRLCVRCHKKYDYKKKSPICTNVNNNCDSERCECA